LKILGIDTSSKFLSIALAENDNILAEESHVLDRKHSSLLVPKIGEMLEKYGTGIREIDGFVIGLGPGSFTGLRIGVSTVKGFGIASGKPCVGVPSIDAIAMNAPDGDKNTVVPVIDAKRQQLYSAIYEKKKNIVSRKAEYLLLTVDKLMKRIKGPALFLGDGIILYEKEIKRLNEKIVFLSEDYWYPKAGNLIKLARGKIEKYKKTDLNKLDPMYLYAKDCQVRK
jgi:tRNA threonylcarbamoyladenosine biosynthesis protein TsaB